MYYDEQDWENISKAYYKKVRNEKELLSLEKKSKSISLKSFRMSNSPIEIKKYSDKILVERMKSLCINLGTALNYGHVIEGVTFGSENELRKILEEKKFFSENNLSILCSPVYKSFLSEAQKYLWQIKNSSGINQDKLIKKFIKKYYWIENTYTGCKLFTNKDILERAKELKYKPFFDVDKIKRYKQKLLKRIRLTNKQKFVIKTIEICFRWQDERKKNIFKAISLLDAVLNEVALRFKIAPTTLKFILHTEINLKNLSDKDFKLLLKQRSAGSAYYTNFKQNLVLYGKDFKYLANSLLDSDVVPVTEIKGVSGSLGKITGVVKICESISDIDKVQPGEILVASMTRPEYFPAMQKAAGFITDEGGITCHAAIIAREMKKPCIIATKIATQILHDRDLVEVDANKGIVKKL